MNDRTVSEHELLIVRTFDAPRELVFRAFAEARHLARWWGPKGFVMGVHTLEFRPGGVFHYSMRSPGGQEMGGKFVYHEILEPEKIVYVSSFSDAEGGLTRHPMWPEWPLQVWNVVTFEEQQGKTLLTLRGYPLNAPEREVESFQQVHSGVRMGFRGTLDQLEEYLATRGGAA